MPPSSSSTRSNQEFNFPLPIFAADGPQLDAAVSRYAGSDFNDLFASGGGWQPSAGPGILTPGADRTTFAKQPSTSTPTDPSGRENSLTFPSRDSTLCSQSPETVSPQAFEETFAGENPDFGYPHYPIPLDENGNPHPMLLASLTLQPLEQTRVKTPFNGLVTPPDSASPGGQWTRQGPKSPVSPTGDKWHIITPDQPHASEYRPPARRKEIFQHTTSPKVHTRGEWLPVPGPFVLPQEIPRKKRDYSANHSEMGWVLAKLREPGEGRPKYSWNIAQIHNPRSNHYLILSGPWAGQIKTIRGFDRVAYSQDQVTKLRHRKQLVHETIRMSEDEISLKSSTFAVDAATSSLGL